MASSTIPAAVNESQEWCLTLTGYVLDPNDKIVDCPPTFTMYEFDAAVNGAIVMKAPCKSDFSLDVEQIAKVVDQEKPICIFLTSPKNPDGRIEVLALLTKPSSI